MKRTYTTPALVTSGHAVRQTLSGVNPGSQESIPLNTYKAAAGSIGFYL